MKIARLLAVSVLCSPAFIASAWADPAAPAVPETYEPGTAPARATEEPSRGPSPGEIARAKEQRATAQQNNDWLLRGYEEQLQARQLAEGQTQNNNLYTELTSSQELAKASGLSSAAPTPAPDNLRTGTNAGAPRLNLRNDALPAKSAPKTDLSQITGIQLQPLITPLESSEVAGMHDLFSNLPALSARNATPSPAPAFGAIAATDSGALDVPGMVAAESDPEKRADLDLTLNALPDEPAAAEKPQHDLELELPTARNTEQLHKQQDAALLVPGKRKTIAPVPISPLLLKPVSDASEMVTVPAPMRGQVDDPYDILR